MTIDEIVRAKTNGLKVASFFSGGGGSSTGYRMAGCKVVFANEFIEAARETYRANCAPDTIVDGRDIRELTPELVLQAIGMKAGELDILDGSPPCASFSTSGKREKAWGKVKKYSDGAQRADDLFFEFARILKGVQPRAFVAENVSGLIKGSAKGYFKEILGALKDSGYAVRAQLLDAQWLGVPQARQRLIFIGMRNDLGVEPTFPKPLAYQYTVRDVLPHITHEKRGGFPENWQTSDRPCSTIMASGGVVSPTAYLSGGSWFKDTSGAIRRLTIDELKLICGFPADFALTGNFAQQWERLGRAVPPLMMMRVAQQIERSLNAQRRKS